MLNTRQWALKKYLENNYEKGKFYTIEEIVNGVVDSEGNPFYKLNTNPKKHDKCIDLSNDIKAINYDDENGYKILIKNSKGGVKIADDESEFESWRQHEISKVEKKYKYLNNLKWKASRNDTMPIINQANNPVAQEKFVSVYGNEKN